MRAVSPLLELSLGIERVYVLLNHLIGGAERALDPRLSGFKTEVEIERPYNRFSEVCEASPSRLSPHFNLSTTDA